VSLLTTLQPGAISDGVVGLLLERQVMALEPCLRKDGVQAIVRGLLRDTLLVYQTTVLPFRRIRVLLKCMELLWKDGNTNYGDTYWTAEHLGDEVLHLLAVEVNRFIFSASVYFNSFVAGHRA
jgi:separase